MAGLHMWWTGRTAKNRIKETWNARLRYRVLDSVPWDPRGVSDLEIGQVARRSLRKEYARHLDRFSDHRIYFIVKIEPNSLYSI